MKNKGFTLIELLAVITVLGLIMLIAVPSTVNVLEKNKKESMINDAKKVMRVVEAEDQQSDYTYAGFVINNHSSYNYYRYTSSKTKWLTMDGLKNSPYDNSYKIVVATPCTCGSIRYYKIYMTDGKKQLRAVKGLPEKYRNRDNLIYNSGDEPYNLTDSTVTRYKMVEKLNGNLNTFFACNSTEKNACN